MEKSIAELRADKAELDAKIVKAKLAGKREKARDAIAKWRDRYANVLDQAERDTAVEILNSLAPAQLTLGGVA